MNLLPRSAIVDVRLSKKSLQRACECSSKGSWQVAPLHLKPAAAAFEVAACQWSWFRMDSWTHWHSFCVSGSWFHASGPSQPPTERSHNNKWRAGEAECSSVSSAESVVVFTANRIPFQWLSAGFLEANFNQSDCLVWSELIRKNKKQNMHYFFIIL